MAPWLILFVSYGLVQARAVPVVRTTAVSLPGLPDELQGMKLALLSDIHLGNRAMTVERLRQVVELVNRQRADLVLMAGDFTTGHDDSAAAERAAALVEPLSALRARLGIVAVLGNHDHWTDPQAIRSALRKAGLVVLENSAVRRSSLLIIGVGDRFSGHADVAMSLKRAAKVGGVPIVLTHSPDLAINLPASVRLLLAGHTHCGQVVLPGFGSLLARAPFDHGRQLYMARYRCGIVVEDDRTTIVTAGVGSGTVPIRMGAPPDMWIITLTQ